MLRIDFGSCKNCGTVFNEETIFCPECGTRYNPVVAEVPVPEPEVKPEAETELVTNVEATENKEEVVVNENSVSELQTEEVAEETKSEEVKTEESKTSDSTDKQKDSNGSSYEDDEYAYLMNLINNNVGDGDDDDEDEDEEEEENVAPNNTNQPTKKKKKKRRRKRQKNQAGAGFESMGISPEDLIPTPPTEKTPTEEVEEEEPSVEELLKALSEPEEEETPVQSPTIEEDSSVPEISTETNVSSEAESNDSVESTVEKPQEEAIGLPRFVFGRSPIDVETEVVPENNSTTEEQVTEKPVILVAPAYQEEINNTVDKLSSNNIVETAQDESSESPAVPTVETVQEEKTVSTVEKTEEPVQGGNNVSPVKITEEPVQEVNTAPVFEKVVETTPVAEVKEEVLNIKTINIEETAPPMEREKTNEPAPIKLNVAKVEMEAQSTNAQFDSTEVHPHEKLNMSDTEKRLAQQKLKELSLDEEMERQLFYVTSPSTRGFKGFFIGEPGTAKENTIDEFGKLLHFIKKISNPEPLYISFSNIPDTFATDRLYVVYGMATAINQLFNLEDFSEDASATQDHYRDLMDHLLRAPRTAYIIISGTSNEKSGFVQLNPRIPFIFDKAVYFPDISNSEIYERFELALPDTHMGQIQPDFKEKFVTYLDRNRRFFPFNNQDLVDYLVDYATRTNEITLPKEKYNDKTLEETFAQIIGMADVKRQLVELEKYLKVRNRLSDAGANLPDFNMHMMFLGNPGVGKTTIARIISKTLFELGFLAEDKLIEVTSKDLIGKGSQTGLKTNRAIMNALGGVLFIDEAYSLNNAGQAGDEAIAIIIKAMMDYKDRLVVMFAGYTLEMKTFVESNSGIQSRINYIFKFEDYSPEELFDIYQLKLKKIGMTSSEEANEAVKKLCKFASNRHNAGNGRFIENLIQKALTKHSTLEFEGDEVLEITKKSIPTVEEIMATSFS